MSTAGKVLVVLVMLSMVLWVVMASAVTQLNTNGGQAVEANNKKIEELQTDLSQAKADLYRLNRTIELEQEKTDLSRAYVRNQLSDTEKRQADIVETLERLKVEVTLAEKAALQAIGNKEQRTKDVADLQIEKARLTEQVDRLKGEDSQLREQSDTLLTNLKNTLAENKKLAERASSKRPATATQ